MGTVTELTDLLTRHPAVASVAVVVIAVVYLAKFTDALDKIVGFGRKVASEWADRRGKINPQAERFDRLKRQVMHVSIVNNLPVELHKLRAFFIEAGLVTRPKFSEFYSQWLAQPAIESGTPVLVPGLFSNERVAQLRAQLDELHL